MATKDQEIHRARIEYHRRTLGNLIKTCTHWFPDLTEEELADKWMSEGALCKSCKKDFGWRCKESPDQTCHYWTIIDRDGVRCVQLNNELLDHAFPRTFDDGAWHWHPDNETDDICLYCGLPEERK